MTRLPGASRVAWLTLGQAALAATLFFLGVLHLPGAPVDAPLPWLVLLLGFALAERAAVDLRVGKEMHSCSLDEIPFVVGLFFIDPVTLVLARLGGRLAAHVVGGRIVPVKLAFNVSLWWMEASAAVLLWHALMDGRDPLSPLGWTCVFVVALLGEALATLSVGSAIRLATGTKQVRSWPTMGVSVVITAVNVCFGLVAVAVILVDWRVSWTLVVIGGVLFLAYRAHVALRERQDAIARINRFTQNVTAERPVEEVAHGVLLEVCDLLSANRAEIVIGDALVLSCDESGALVSSTDVRTSLAHDLHGRLPDLAVLASRTTRDRALRSWLGRSGIVDAVVVPLRSEDRVVGALTVADRRINAGTFSSADQHVLGAIGNHAVVAVENARLTSRLRGQVVEQHRRARHDALTGLPNRVSLHEHLSDVLVEGAGVAVLLLDLDGFKEINDTLGHASGDDLLVGVARRLRSLESRGMFLSRLGGDEFVVVAPARDVAAAQAAATAVRDVLAPAFPLGELTIGVQVSVGIAVAPDDGRDQSTLLRRADIAMYAAKQRGTGAEHYSASIDENTPDRLALVTDLRAAVKARALTVHYQPKVDLARGCVAGVEALLRWYDPVRGAVPPDEFIPLAERWGLIGELTSFVLDTTLAQCAAWRAAGLDLGVAVNLSPRVLHSAELADELVELLERHAVPASAVTLELTEGSVMLDMQSMCALLHRLRALGVHLSIDDLGTGYSSLAYLKTLPVDEIKLDKSFIFGMAGSDDDVAIASALVQVGHRLGLLVVAEGVEDERTYDALRAMGCDVAQGYWMSRPLPADDVADFVREWDVQRVPAAV